MKILFLGPPCENIFNFISSFGDEITVVEEPLNEDSSYIEGKDFLISYRYRHLVKGNVLDKFPGRAINLHISFLPWNKGADPNIWSFLEDTPKGVSIHCMTPAFDAGSILAQREVAYSQGDTLRTTYQRLLDKIEDLFKDIWPEVRLGKLEPKPQSDGGSYHRKKDLMQFQHLLTQEWDTPVRNLVGKAKVKNEEVQR